MNFSSESVAQPQLAYNFFVFTFNIVHKINDIDLLKIYLDLDLIVEVPVSDPLHWPNPLDSIC